MTLKDIRSDLTLIAQRSKMSKDQRLYDDHINYLIHKYRAVGIHEVYPKQGYVDPVWVQDLGPIELTIVDSAEEISLACGNVKLGKATLPRVLSIGDDSGVYRVSGTSNQKTYHPITIQRFFEIDQSSDRAKFDYFFRVGDAFYLTNPPKHANFKLVLDNPMDGDFFDNTNQHIIREGFVYSVTSGAVSYNGAQYIQGATFTGGVLSSWSGNGKVTYKDSRRPLTEDDPYPVTFQLGEYISMSILTKEFGLEQRAIADIKNNNADDLTLQQHAPQQGNG